MVSVPVARYQSTILQLVGMVGVSFCFVFDVVAMRSRIVLLGLRQVVWEETDQADLRKQLGNVCLLGLGWDADRYAGRSMGAAGAVELSCKPT